MLEQAGEVDCPSRDYPVRSVRRLVGGVARPGFPRAIVEFQGRFPDEAACRAYLFESRWPRGYRCPRCGGGEVGVEHRRHVWQCKRCGHQASVTAGTVMHKTRTPLTLWFWAAYLVATHTPGENDGMRWPRRPWRALVRPLVPPSQREPSYVDESGGTR
jgi:ribosomal protein L37AE/L43A